MSKKSSNLAFNVAFCGIVSAIGVMVMFGSLIPSLAYAVPAVSGILIWTICEQINFKWAMLSYIAVALLSFMLIPEIEANLFLIFFFGYYPTLREILDKIKNKVLRFVAKLCIFNVAVVIAYNILTVVLSAEQILEGLEDFGQYAVYVFWGVGNVAFVIYEFCLNIIKEFYIKIIKPKLRIKLK